MQTRPQPQPQPYNHNNGNVANYYPQPQYNAINNSGYYANNNNPVNGNQRISNPMRPSGISNGYRSNLYSNRQYGPNYSSLGRSVSASGNTYGNSRPATPAYGANNGYGNNYNRISMSNPNNGFNAMNMADRKMYPIVCATCGIHTEVPFPPRESTPVFCRTCYNNQKNNR
jgi:CxxC-x17-CxxC domain-containing protein